MLINWVIDHLLEALLIYLTVIHFIYLNSIDPNVFNRYISRIFEKAGVYFEDEVVYADVIVYVEQKMRGRDTLKCIAFLVVASPVLGDQITVPFVVQDGLIRYNVTFFELLECIPIFVYLVSIFLFCLEMSLNWFRYLLVYREDIFHYLSSF